jgi:2-haloacid dehalogenase
VSSARIPGSAIRKSSLSLPTAVVAFDVNETLLDLSSLDDTFEQLLGSRQLRGQWFAQMLQLAFVGGLTGEYIDFTTAQRAALRMLAVRVGRQVTDAAVSEVVERMRSLPAHPEVPEALARLASSPYRVVALTNSTQDVAEAQLRNAGIDPAFEYTISADSVGALKPAAAPYHLVASRCGVEIGEVLLVAAHAWDVSGAMAAGARAAFVARPGMVPSPLGRRPDFIEPDIAHVVNRIIAESAL